MLQDVFEKKTSSEIESHVNLFLNLQFHDYDIFHDII